MFFEQRGPFAIVLAPLRPDRADAGADHRGRGQDGLRRVHALQRHRRRRVGRRADAARLRAGPVRDHPEAARADLHPHRARCRCCRSPVEWYKRRKAAKQAGIPTPPMESGEQPRPSRHSAAQRIEQPPEPLTVVVHHGIRPAFGDDASRRPGHHRRVPGDEEGGEQCRVPVEARVASRAPRPGPPAVRTRSPAPGRSARGTPRRSGRRGSTRSLRPDSACRSSTSRKRTSRRDASTSTPGARSRTAERSMFDGVLLPVQEQVLLAREVVEDRDAGHPGLPGDLGDRDRVEPAIEEQPGRDLGDPGRVCGPPRSPVRGIPLPLPCVTTLSHLA